MQILERVRRVMTLEGLTDWLKTRDPERSYPPGSCHSCLLARYIEDKTGEMTVVGIGNVTVPGHGSLAYESVLEDVAWGEERRARHNLGGISFCGEPAPWAEERGGDENSPAPVGWFTYGAALRRAEMLQPETVS